MPNPKLTIEANFAGHKVDYTMEVGTSDDDFVHKKHSIKIKTDEGSLYGKVKDKELEEFCILTLQLLGYKIKPL